MRDDLHFRVYRFAERCAAFRTASIAFNAYDEYQNFMNDYLGL